MTSTLGEDGLRPAAVGAHRAAARFFAEAALVGAIRLAGPDAIRLADPLAIRFADPMRIS